ncbi:MAG TPA: F0F1 ATP synthase subunit delta [Candidatus Paceibacterota bacterium]|nr:F0F1 ATP synthase subunit delta [Candidatus Paceibacterota bacterium]
MEKAYSQALWEMVERGMEPRAAVRALHESLKARGRDALMPRIAIAFERLAARENEKNSTTLIVAHAKDAHPHSREIKEVLDEIGVHPSDVRISVDPRMIGGWRLEGRGRLIDASHKKYLLDMYNRAVS